MGGNASQENSGGGGAVPGKISPEGFNVSNFGKSLGAGMQNAFEAGNQVYDQPLYAGMGKHSYSGLNNIYNTAKGSQGMFDSATDYASGLLNSGGLTAEQRQALSTMGSVGNSYGGIARDGGLTGNMRAGINGTGDVAGSYNRMFNSAGGKSLTERELMSTAQGGMLNGSNPYFERNLAKAKDNTYADVMASLGGSGRTGSSVHMDELGGALGNLENSARGAQYETERDRQMQAISSIEGMRQQGFGNQNAALQGRLGALGQQFGMENTGLGNKMAALSGKAGAAGQQFSGQQQGISNAMGASAALPGLYNAALMPGQTMLQAGQVRDADAQAKLMADYDLFNRKDPYSHLAKYAGLLNGSQQTSGIKEETPWWQSLLGGAATFASFL